MRAPTVHLNGTAREELVRQYEAAVDGLRLALAGLRDAEPHARDYYPQGDGALKEAQREHASRIDRVRAVLSEIDELHERVMS